MRIELGIISILPTWVFLGIYIVIGEIFVDKAPDIYYLFLFSTERDGTIFCLAVTISRLIESMCLRKFIFFARILLVFFIYVLIYGIVAFPLMIVSFFQPFYRNIVAHFTIIFMIIELVLTRFQNKTEIR
jgi:hypothetical protein